MMREKGRKIQIKVMSIIGTLLAILCLIAYATQNMSVKVASVPKIEAYENADITLKVSQTPNLDVILTKSKTAIDVTTFEANLKKELVRQNVMTQAEIDSGKLKISAVSAQNVTSQNSFTWTRDVKHTDDPKTNIGSIDITNSGKDILMIGNTKNAGKNAIWIIPENDMEQEFTFNYSIDFGDSFNAAGMLLRVQKVGNYIEGYLLSFNFPNESTNKLRGTWYKATGEKGDRANGALWKFSYRINDNSTPFSVGTDAILVKKLNINKSGTLNIKVSDTEIKIAGGGVNTTYTFPQGKSYGTGYGFFSDHFSHNCSSKGEFSLRNINLKTTSVKKFTEILQAPDWRNGSAKVLVNVEDGLNPQFSDKDELAAIVAKLMNNDVYYIGWGTNTNQSQINDLIQKNDNKGTYIANSSSEAIQATVDYIKTLLGENVTNKVIAGEPTRVEITTPEGGVVTPTDEFPSGVWKVIHDYNYYENPQGQYEKDGLYSNELISSFDNVGKYTILFEDKYVTDIYAHRRPVSSFSLKLDGADLKLNSTSYDLDIEVESEEYDIQKANNGIKTEKWEYKKVNDVNNEWTEIPSEGVGKTATATLEENTDYIIKLTVTDYQGVSTESTKYVTTENKETTPIASFKIINKTISKYEKLEIIDESYDPSGADLTYSWKVKRQGASSYVYTGNTPLTNFNSSSYGEGKYTIELTVSKTYNGKTITSEVFSQDIEITKDTTAPIVIIDPVTKYAYNENIDISVDFKDNESGLKSYKYVINKNNTPAEESEYKEVTLSGKETIETITIPSNQWDENLYLHIIAENNEGVKTEERIVGKYYIEPTYEVIVQAIDNTDRNIVQNATYNIQAEYADGSVVDVVTNAVTDRNGKITIPKAKLHKAIGLKIDNIAVPNGYDIAGYKNVGIDTTTYSVVLDNSRTSGDVNANVSNNGQTLTVKVPVSRKQFELKISNVDSFFGNYISNSEFVLKQNGTEMARGVTTDGIVTLKGIIAGANKTGEYVLIQEKVNSIYKNIGTTTLKIDFDENGNVKKVNQKLFATNNAVEIPDNTKAEIVVKNERIDKSSFNVNINVKEIGTNNALEGSKYKIKVEGADGLEYTTVSEASDANGNVRIKGLLGTGLLRLTFIHEEAPKGYAINPINEHITIVRNSDKSIIYRSASKDGIFERIQDENIYVRLTNTLKNGTNNLKIKVFPKDSSLTGLDGINVKVYEVLNNILVGEGKTDINGIFEVDGIIAQGKGEVIYKIVSDDNQIITSPILFTIDYDNNKKITSASKIKADDNVKVYYSEEDAQNIYKYIANVEIGVENKTISGDNKLIIMKQDVADGKKLEGAQYQVKIMTSTISANVFTTDVNGRIETNLPEDDNIIVQLREIAAPQGYREDTTSKTVVLHRNSEHKLEVKSLNNLNADKVTVDNDGNLNIIEESKSLDNASVVFKMAATNEDNSLNLGGVQFKIVEPITGYEEIVTSNVDGYIPVGKVFETSEGKSYIFEITEISTVSPYALPEKPIKVEVRFEKDGTAVQYKGTTYLQGSELLSEKVASYDAGKNQVNISLKVINKIDTNANLGQVYDIDITKIDKDGQIVSGSKYDIEVRPYAESSIVKKDCSIISGVEISNLAIRQDKTTIILKEVNPAIGCNLDSDIKIATIGLDENGNIKVISDTTSKDNITVTLEKDENTGRTIVKINITAEEEKAEPVPSDSYYIKSNKYTIVSATIKEVDYNTTATDFLGNLNTNGAMKVYDKDGNEKQGKDIIITGDILKVTYQGTEYVYDIYVNPPTPESYYIRSAKYTIKSTEIENVPLNTAVADFLVNIDTNATMVQVYDADGNTKQGLDVIVEGDKLQTQFDGITYEYEIHIQRYYIRSDKYTVTNSTIENVVDSTTVKNFLKNINTNGTMKVYDADGNLKQDTDLVIKGEELQVVYDGKTYIYEIFVNDPDVTLTFNIYNRSYGDWTEGGILIKEQIHTPNHPDSHLNCITWRTITKEATQTLEGAQKLIRIFDLKGDSDSKGFGFIKGSDIEIEARLVNKGIVDNDIYETVLAESIEANTVEGTHKVKLYKNYENKTVEFTVKQIAPGYNYKRNIPDNKFILEFDTNGKVKSGNITQGIDTEEIAIGGISANGIVDNIEVITAKYIYAYMSQIQKDLQQKGLWHPRKNKIDTYDINSYNSIGSNTVYIGLLNKEIEDNQMQIKVNLKDADTEEGVNGPVNAIIMDTTIPGESKLIETKSADIYGTGVITLDNTYANKKLTVILQQTSSATLRNYRYVDNSKEHIQFEVEFDDNAEIVTFNEIASTPHSVSKNVNGHVVTYDIYNDLIYNFALNLTKLDENNNPLQGVRVQTNTSVITNTQTNDKHHVFQYGSRLTDENGKVKLKIYLPETGSYKYYGKTIEIDLNEYYVPDNYRAQEGMRVRALFDQSGNMIDCSLVQGEGDDKLKITGQNNIGPDDMERNSFDIEMTNSRLTEKPLIHIENKDIDDGSKLEGTKYQITVQDIKDYEINSLIINETKYSPETNSEGQTDVRFDNAHALRTMIYRIKEVQSSESYITNKDIILKVQFDREGKVAKIPEILSCPKILNAKNEYVNIAKVVGDATGHTDIQIEIVNELKPKFIINVSRQDTNNNVIRGKEFKAISEEKDENGNYTQIEERFSRVTDTGYELGFKQDPTLKTIRYTIYEKTGDVYTERGKTEVSFDRYGNVINGNIIDQNATTNYITHLGVIKDVKYINVTIKAEIFKIGVQVVDKNSAGYSLAGYAFKVTNSKGEVSNIEAKTDSVGNVIEIVGDCYKGETITYNFEQVSSPIDYNEIPNFTITVEFNDDGTIKDCTPATIEDVYDLITTKKQDDIQMQIRMWTTPALRNEVKMTLYDDSNPNLKIDNGQFKIEVASNYSAEYEMTIEYGEGNTDLGSYKNYVNKTETFTITQIEADSKYMLNDKPIQIAVKVNQDGIIEKAEDIRVLATDGYVEIDYSNTIGTSNIVLKTANRRKEIMNLEVHSTQSTEDKVANTEFQIIQENKSELYSDTQTTDMNGEATLYVGPYYRDEEVTYLVTNTKPSREFKKVPDARFTLTYDANGKVTSYKMPEDMKRFMSIDILNSNIADIKITMQTDPLLTIGVDTVDEVTKAKLIGGKFEIQQADNTSKTDTVVTSANSISHAVVGEAETSKVVQYNIIEKEAPIGYKYKNKDQVIGVIEMEHDTEGRIINGTQKIIEGYNYIRIKPNTDKNRNFDLDIEIDYEEIEEFKIIIENYNIVDNTQKIQSTFNATLTNQGSTSAATDASGIALVNFGAIRNVSTTQLLTLSQSDVPVQYSAISPIQIQIEFDESGKIKTVTPQTGDGIASLNTSYTIDSTGSYTIKITVKNSPTTLISITNISDGTNTVPLQSTMTLTNESIDSITMNTGADGKCSANITSVPRPGDAYYTISQTSVQRGYTLNKDIRLKVSYDSNGRVSGATIVSGANYADESVVNVTYTSDYQVELTIKNKQVFEIYLEAEDAYDSNIKLSGVNVSIQETTYSQNIIHLTTDENGLAQADLASTYAGTTLIYHVSIINNVPGYSVKSNTVSGDISVTFDASGSVIACQSSNPQIEANYGSGKAIEVKVKYIPVLTLNITRRNTTTNATLSGRELTVNSEAIDAEGLTVTKTTDADGNVNIDNAGIITNNNRITYTITETPVDSYTTIEKMEPITITANYDNNGNLAGITTNNSTNVVATGTGTRTLNVEIGSNSKATVAIVSSDYYNHLERILGTFEIKSSKGETATIQSSMDTTNIVEKLGRLYPGETIEYIIKQTKVDERYYAIPDTKFTVEYNANGTIETVTSANPDVLKVGQINQTSTDAQANINFEIYNKPALLVNIGAYDKQYNSGVLGLEFKIKDETSGYETQADSVTDENGNVTIPVGEAYENTTVTYTITNTKTMGGYKTIPTFQVEVQYGELGTILEQGTKVINTQIAQVTQGYSEKLYKESKTRGIQVKVEAETELGIGIIKVDTEEKPISGINFTIVAQDVTNGTSSETPESITATTNEVGEVSKYLGELPRGKTIEYTISEVLAPEGFKKVKDIILRVNYDIRGRITSYSTVQKQADVTIEVATSNLYKMPDSKETVHIRIKVVNNDKVTFKIVNTENVTKLPIQGSGFEAVIETAAGTILNTTAITNIDGEIVFENIDAKGTIRFLYNQSSVPEGYKLNNINSGYITIDKSSDIYKLTYNDSSDDLVYNIDSETGIVTIYVQNDSNLIINLMDVDAETQETVLGATHTIKAQYGEKSESNETILNKTDNIINYNNGEKYESQEGTTNIQLGSTYNFIDKKVIYTIETPDSAAEYAPIGRIYLTVEYDSKGRVQTVNGQSSRLISATKGGDHVINAVIGYGDMDFYTIKVVTEGTNNVRINNSKFDITLTQDGNEVETYKDLLTQDKFINNTLIEQGIIELRKLKYEGNIKLTLNETESAEGYSTEPTPMPLDIELEARLDKTDPDDIKLDVNNINSPNATVNVNRDTRTIEIIIVNTPAIKLELNKQDNFGNSIIGVKFNLQIQEKDSTNIESLGVLQTDDMGIAIYDIINKYTNKTILIRLDEIMDAANQVFKPIDPIILEAYINSKGKIQEIQLNSGNANATVTNTESKISMNVVNTLKETEKPYTIDITKVDGNDHRIKLPDVLFQVRVTPSVGISVYKAVYTDENGNIKLDGLIGSGEIDIELKEVLTPEGYIVGAQDGYYYYKIRKINDSYQKISSNAEDSLWKIDNNNKIVSILVENEAEKVGMAIEKVDRRNSDIKIKGAKIKLVNASTSKEYESITDGNGIAYFLLNKGENIVEYKVQEIEAPQGYELDNTIKTLYIQYDSEGKILNSIEGDGLTFLERSDNYIKEQLSNEQKSLGIEPYNIQIINVDKQDNSIVIPDSTFDINIIQSVGPANINITATTDNNGQITVPGINGAGDITIKLVNNIAGNGYAINANNNEVKIARLEETGTTSIVEQNNISAIYDDANNLLKIYVESEKEQNKYTFKLNVIDRATGKLITDTNAKYKLNINDIEIDKNVDSEGKILLKGLDIEDIPSFVISIQEQQNPLGYVSINDEQAIEINVDVASIYDTRILKDVTVTSGNNIQLGNTSSNCVEINLLYDSDGSKIYYIKSDIYTVTDKTIEDVKQNTTAQDFLSHIDTNGTMKLYDQDGNEKQDTDIMEIGDKLKVTFDGIEYEYEILVIAPYYIESDKYTITENTIEEVEPNTTVEDFLANIDTNGTMKPYDKDGNEKQPTDMIETGDKLKVTYDGTEYEYEVSIKEEPKDPYYIKSDEYTITDTEIGEVEPNTTVGDFLANIDTNGDIKVYDKDGNEKQPTDIIEAGDKVKVTYDGTEYEYEVSVKEEPKDPYYIKSDEYKVTESTIEEVEPNTTLENFLANIDTNGDIKVYDAEGNEKQPTDVIESGDRVKVTYDGTEYEYEVSVKEDKPDEDYYIKSDIYLVTEKTIERVKPETTITNFLANIDTNGDMKVYDLEGNEKTGEDLVGTGYILKSTYKGVVYEYQVAVLGDLDGNGRITATDISMYNQVMIEKIQLNEIQQKAADLDFNGKVTVTDFSTINKVFVGTIIL